MSPPDFVITVAMKCGTTTLQLRAQPASFLPTPNEPNFFSNDEIYQRGVAWYRSLFADAPPDVITGEASTPYTKPPAYSKAAGRRRHHLPQARLLHLMRNPVDRLVSHYIHGWTVRDVDGPIERHPELVACGRYAMQLQPCVERFAFARILPVFLERLVETARSSRPLGCMAPAACASGR